MKVNLLKKETHLHENRAERKEPTGFCFFCVVVATFTLNGATFRPIDSTLALTGATLCPTESTFRPTGATNQLPPKFKKHPNHYESQ
ncbi:hypothetical protein [Paenisporosarcina sp. TG-14]|uniref:hypothetical protein n=1 Tax=Paenisporosarcina sp. TG-14 TaxID=1231057 RepID=UPI0002D49D28|nr:hypothetical protein [Paenisporosarcina sp. TG-14]